MTVICGIVADDGTIIIAGDAACTSKSGAQSIMANSKVFRNGPFLMGFCGSPRHGEVMRYRFQPPKHPRGLDTATFIRTLFIDAAREAMRKAGALQIVNGVESMEGSEMLVGYRRRLFDVEDGFEVFELADTYVAIGGGAEVAQGALFVSADRPPRKRILAAMAASERYNAGVRRPFTVLTMEAQ